MWTAENSFDTVQALIRAKAGSWRAGNNGGENISRDPPPLTPGNPVGNIDLINGDAVMQGQGDMNRLLRWLTFPNYAVASFKVHAGHT